MHKSGSCTQYVHNGFSKDLFFILKCGGVIAVFIGSRQIAVHKYYLEKYAERELILSLTEHCSKLKKVCGTPLKMI